MPTRLKIVPELCIGCRSCEVACSLENEGIVAIFAARIKVIGFIESEAYGLPYNLPLVCHQCSDAPCLKACPEDALRRDRDPLGVVHLIETNCNSCGLCIKACPFGAIRRVKQMKKIIKCELCGGAPACAEMCPSGAIRFESSGDFYARETAFELQAYRILSSPKKKSRPV